TEATLTKYIETGTSLGVDAPFILRNGGLTSYQYQKIFTHLTDGADYQEENIPTLTQANLQIVPDELLLKMLPVAVKWRPRYSYDSNPYVNLFTEAVARGMITIHKPPV